MARIDIRSNGGGGSVATGVLQLQGGVAMSSTLTAVTDQNNTTSPLKLSTTAVQVVSPLRITTDDPSDMYLDCEDGSANNRFNITRNTASQQVNLNFASNPAGSTTVVGGIRTYVDGVNLTEVMKFREDGQLQIGSTSASAMYWDNVNNRLGVGLNTPVAGPFQVKTTQSNANGSIIFTNNTTATILAATDTGSALTQLQFRASSYNFTDTAGMRIASTGYATTPTAMLQIIGSGSTSATTSLLVQNSSGTAALTITDDGKVNANQLVFGGSNGYIGINNSPNIDSALRNIRTDFSSSPLSISSGEVGVGDTTTYPSAIFAIGSTTRGFLPPRMTNAQRAAITTPAIGLMVYCTDAVEGVYVYKSTGWTFVA